jgi:hypothetical protein
MRERVGVYGGSCTPVREPAALEVLARVPIERARMTIRVVLSMTSRCCAPARMIRKPSPTCGWVRPATARRY